jgi:hypothetical protein
MVLFHGFPCRFYVKTRFLPSGGFSGRSSDAPCGARQLRAVWREKCLRAGPGPGEKTEKTREKDCFAYCARTVAYYARGPVPNPAHLSCALFSPVGVRGPVRGLEKKQGEQKDQKLGRPYSNLVRRSSVKIASVYVYCAYEFIGAKYFGVGFFLTEKLRKNTIFRYPARPCVFFSEPRSPNRAPDRGTPDFPCFFPNTGPGPGDKTKKLNIENFGPAVFKFGSME